MTKEICDICSAPMILDENLGLTQSVKGVNKYRRRRYKCSISTCGYSKMVFADGRKDSLKDEQFVDIRKQKWRQRWYEAKGTKDFEEE